MQVFLHSKNSPPFFCVRVLPRYRLLRFPQKLNLGLPLRLHVELHFCRLSLNSSRRTISIHPQLSQCVWNGKADPPQNTLKHWCCRSTCNRTLGHSALGARHRPQSATPSGVSSKTGQTTTFWTLGFKHVHALVDFSFAFVSKSPSCLVSALGSSLINN